MKTYFPPPDKAVTHRALMLAAVARGTTRVRNPSVCQDTLVTAACLKALGARIRFSKGLAVVEGAGLRGLRRSRRPLNAGASGTTLSLLTGLLAGQTFDSVITGEGSLLKRPVGRAAVPLRRMGARVRLSRGRAPVRITGSPLKGAAHRLAAPSAQVKSAVLLAGLYAEGPTAVTGRFPTRDHTERLLKHFGARLSAAGRRIRLIPGPLTAADLRVPGDISSAAPFITAACLLKGGGLRIKNVGLNPGRTGLVRILRKMGAKITVRRGASSPEPCGDILVRSSQLRGVRIKPGEVPSMVDELPLLALAAARSRGTTVISGVGALKHKESDRLRATLALFRSLGLKAKAPGDRLVISGPQEIAGGGAAGTFGDHRMAMAAAVGSLLAPRPLRIQSPACVKKSYPAFFVDFNRIFK